QRAGEPAPESRDRRGSSSCSSCMTRISAGRPTRSASSSAGDIREVQASNRALKPEASRERRARPAPVMRRSRTRRSAGSRSRSTRPWACRSAAIRLTLLLSSRSRSESARWESGPETSSSQRANPWEGVSGRSGRADWSGSRKPPVRTRSMTSACRRAAVASSAVFWPVMSALLGKRRQKVVSRNHLAYGQDGCTIQLSGGVMPSTTGTAPSGRAPGPAASKQARHRADDILFGERGSRIYALLTPRLLRGVYRRIAEDVADAAPTGGRLLDVGTGPGTMLDAIARYRPDLELRGADPSPGMVAEAGRRLGPLGAG